MIWLLHLTELLRLPDTHSTRETQISCGLASVYVELTCADVGVDLNGVRIAVERAHLDRHIREWYSLLDPIVGLMVLVH